MRSLAAALCALLGALVLASPAAADAFFGVADDHGKYAEDGGAAFFTRLRGAGLSANRVTVLWDAEAPRTIADRSFLDRSLPQAAAQGVRVVFAVYPRRPDALTTSPVAPAQFAEFLQLLARRYPQVREFVVGNEPNQPRFWRPQFAADGTPVAAATYEPVLAAAYDALKAVDPGLRVVGVGLSERGNDNPTAPSNVSTSPVRFLRDLGAAYRASGRTAPLMDELALHPYPESPRDDLLKPYAWPSAGLGNLDRVKQAVWDAFDGTGQPTVEEGLMLRIGEIGWQVEVVPSLAELYAGSETAAVTDETRQASLYAGLVRYIVCDPAVGSAFFFGLIDEPDLDRFQAALLRRDGSPRPAYDSVRTAIADTGGRCAGTPRAWRHTTSAVEAGADFGADLARARSWKQKAWGFNVTAGEEATYRAVIVPLGARTGRAEVERALQGGRAGLRAEGTIQAHWHPRVVFPRRRIPAGRYAYAVEITATMNPARKSVFTSAPFRVGERSTK